MDRPIEQSVRKKRNIKRLGASVFAVAILVIVFFTISGLIRPSVKQSKIRTTVADIGPMEETITGSGNVLPEYEHVISSPIDTRITRIIKKPGDELSEGEPIVELDIEQARLEVERLDGQIAIKRNERERAKIELENRLADLESRAEIKKLELKSIEFDVSRNKKLVGLGLVSEDDVRKAETDAERARIEIEHFKTSMVNAKRELEVRLRGLDLETDIRAKERDEAAHRMQLATAVSDRSGIVTWVVPSEGASIHRGDEIARVADLNSYRVEATFSDIHATRLRAGLPVRVKVGEEMLEGMVSNVLPLVEDGVITLQVALEESSHPNLRNNLRADVHVITARKERAVRIRRGAFVTVDGLPAFYVVKGERAVRVSVSFGISNFEHYEITSGLEPGDEVIISDMSDYIHVKEVRIQ